jgi:hypothetical protein
MAHGRLAEIEASCRARDIALTHHGAEGPQQVDISIIHTVNFEYAA